MLTIESQSVGVNTFDVIYTDANLCSLLGKVDLMEDNRLPSSLCIVVSRPCPSIGVDTMVSVVDR